MDDVFASIDKEIAAIQQENAAAQSAYQNASSGALMGGSMLGIDHAKAMRDQQIQSAIYTLTESRRIRNNPELMKAIRLWVYDKRQEFAALLDDLGEK